MVAVSISALQVLSCIGLGALVLRLLNLSAEQSFVERAAFGFPIGMGVLGWMVFMLGVFGEFSELLLNVLLIAGAACTYFVYESRRTDDPRLGQNWRPGWFGAVIVGVVTLGFAYDLLEGTAPPADGDSLWYHFTIVKSFVEAGRIEFVPRAIDGAAPLLIQMTYVLPLKLGGEQAMTLWTALSGSAATILVYVFCRRHMGPAWSLAVAALFLTTPAVVYGAGGGQVEVRNAMFVLLAAEGVSRARQTGDLRFAALAGLAAGFFVGTKYLGLMFAASCGLALLWSPHAIRLATVFSVAVLAAGGQWYAWNWYHTGDPIFPVLFAVLGGSANGLWDQNHHEALNDAFFNKEKAMAVNLWTYFAYPVIAMFSRVQQIESGRTGFGPILVLILPFALAGAWKARAALLESRLLTWFLIAVVFYTLWFFVGSSHRVRHLLPIYPLLLICGFTAAAKWAEASENVILLRAAAAFTLALQLAGHSLFSISYVQRIVGNESREQFLSRTVVAAPVAFWINENLGDKNKILVAERQLVYLIDIPLYQGHTEHEALVDIRPSNRNSRRFATQLASLGIDHLLVRNWRARGTTAKAGYIFLLRDLQRRGCVEEVQTFEERTYASRTLPGISSNLTDFAVLHFKPQACRAWN